MNTTTDKVPLSIESRKVLARLSITYIVLQRNRLLSKQYYKLANNVISSLNNGGGGEKRRVEIVMAGKSYQQSLLSPFGQTSEHTRPHTLWGFLSAAALLRRMFTHHKVWLNKPQFTCIYIIIIILCPSDHQIKRSFCGLIVAVALRI